jgi:hypothetical protein
VEVTHRRGLAEDEGAAAITGHLFVGAAWKSHTEVVLAEDGLNFSSDDHTAVVVGV